METNKMAVMPVNKLLLNMGLPMILSMMLQAVYNIVDSAFVANMPENGEAALNALTLAFPVQMLMVAIGVGTGVGAGALISKSLGAEDRERASRATGNTIFLAAVIYVIFLLFGLFGVDAYIASQSGNPLIVSMAADYLRICCVYSFGIVFFSVFEKILQATGRSIYSTAAQISGALVNVVLDPILIYGMFGLPVMGVRGAAYATVIGQIVSFLVALFAHLRFNRELENRLAYLKPSKSDILNIYAIGFPAILAQALMSVMTYLLNIIFVRIGENVVTAYGLYYKIQQFVLFAAFGLRDAITPVISFNHGKRDRKRVSDGVTYGVSYTLFIMAAGFLLLEVFARPFSTLFGLSGETEALCVSAIRIISISYVFAGLNISLQGVFQALDSGLPSLVISVCRQFLFVIPAAWLLASLVIKNADTPVWIVWFSFLIAEALSAAIACLFLRTVWRTKIRVL
ncbi:MAG: MATE family efflux transporter [Eubacteriales bacterium]|nr:MATE family efflux transporter [Eubacteriales bacterium]